MGDAALELAGGALGAAVTEEGLDVLDDSAGTDAVAAEASLPLGTRTVDSLPADAGATLAHPARTERAAADHRR